MPTAAPLSPPRPVTELDTPALLVDLDILERNLHRMAGFMAEFDCTIRPHFKAHRMPEICRRQVALGAHGLTCAKLGEAEALAQSGFDHLLVANEVVGAPKWRRLARLARRHHVTVGIDHLEVAAETARAAREEQAEVGVLVEVNLGLDRCGVPPGQPAVDLARRCAELRGLRFRGIMGYEGHVVMLPREQKEAVCREAISKLTDTARLCEQAGLEVEVVSAGGTGSWDITAAQPGVTELQCGTYALMDLLFREHAGAQDFDYGCTVLTTVISRPAADRAVVDAGKKGLHPSFGMSRPVSLPGAELTALHSEHGLLQLEGAARDLKVGEQVRFVPYYLEGTVNLYDRAYAVRDGLAVEEWEITGRGRSQ